MIKLQIVGNLGADCIQKEVNGKTVINFNVAHHEKFKDSQGGFKRKNHLGKLRLLDRQNRNCSLS